MPNQKAEEKEERPSGQLCYNHAGKKLVKLNQD
jgi:hypothetical protein